MEHQEHLKHAPDANCQSCWPTDLLLSCLDQPYTMISVPTVLVLGAGASAPFGYPVGSALTERIKNELRPKQPGQLHHDLISAGFSDDLLLRFRDQLRYSQ